MQELVSFDSIAGAQNVEMYQCIETATKVKEGSGDGEKAASLIEEGNRESEIVRHAHHAHTHKNKETHTMSKDDPDDGYLSTAGESIKDAAQGTETAYKYHMGWANA